jgi:aminomethyltransferase
MTSPRKTPLFEQHNTLGARIVDFAGWLLPVQYEGVLAEHHACRQSAAVFDTSHMGQFVVRGSSAAGELSAALTQDAEALPVGRGKYGFLLNEQGGVIDDTILFRLGPEEFLLVVNAATAEGDANVLRRCLAKAGLTIRDDWGKLDVQGPRSLEVLAKQIDGDLSALRYFDARSMRIVGVEGVVSRAGYTGELGYEVFLPAEALRELFSALVAHPAVRPAGLGARDSLRLEMCYPLYGHELSEQINPIEADLASYVDPFRAFVGAGALRKIVQSCPTRKLVALRTRQRRQFHADDAILADGGEVGRVTSGAFSPSLEAAVGMGFVRADRCEVGTSLIVRTARAEIPAVVADKPLYTGGGCRGKANK